MTKYILNSGGVRNNSELAKIFFAEVVKGLGNNPRILICHFAQPRENWEKKFVEDKEKIFKLFPGDVNPIFSLALPKTFEQQIKDSEVIYIKGGDDHLLLYWFKKFNIPKIWEGKVIAASSAGSDVLVKSFWTCDWRKNMDGLGILPIKFLPHYKSLYGDDDPRGPIDWDQAYEDLEKYGDTSLPIYALEEGEFVVIES